VTNDLPSDDVREQGHEPLRVDTRAVWYSALVLVVTVVGALALMYVMLERLLPEGAAVSVMDPSDQATPPTTSIPNIDANQIAQREALRRLERQLLTRYGWVDPAAGVARIPIERSMEIIAVRGAVELPPSDVVSTQTEDVAGQSPAAEPENRPSRETAETEENE
jgi:hypothetical protein